MKNKRRDFIIDMPQVYLDDYDIYGSVQYTGLITGTPPGYYGLRVTCWGKLKQYAKWSYTDGTNTITAQFAIAN